MIYSGSSYEFFEFRIQPIQPIFRNYKKNLILNQKEESTDYLPFSVAYQQSPEFKDLKLGETFFLTVFVFQIFFATIADKLRDEIGLNPNFESEQLYLQLSRPSSSFFTFTTEAETWSQICLKEPKQKASAPQQCATWLRKSPSSAPPWACWRVWPSAGGISSPAHPGSCPPWPKLNILYKILQNKPRRKITTKYRCKKSGCVSKLGG